MEHNVQRFKPQNTELTVTINRKEINSMKCTQVEIFIKKHNQQEILWK